MSERDDTSGPASSAAASTLRGPSEAAAELAARAADASADAEAAAAARASEAAERERKERSAEEKARDADARAPVGFLRSMRFFSLAGVGLIGVVVAVVNLMEATVVPWAVLGGLALVWLPVLGLAALDAATWRRRLPFSLDGFDHVTGRDHTGEDDAPWVALRVRVVLRNPTTEANAARKGALEVLAARANHMLHKDRDLKDLKGRDWQVDGDACVGQATFALYTTRVLERWLRKDATLLARAFPVERVEVRARYTGDSTRIG